MMRDALSVLFFVFVGVIGVFIGNAFGLLFSSAGVLGF